jgi:hypothetical protein
MTETPLDPKDREPDTIVHPDGQHPNTPAFRRGCDICWYGPNMTLDEINKMFDEETFDEDED